MYTTDTFNNLRVFLCKIYSYITDKFLIKSTIFTQNILLTNV